MIREKAPTYSHLVDAAAFHPGNVRDENTDYDRTIRVDADGLAMPLFIDVDAEGRVLMIEVMNASRALRGAVLATFQQIDREH